MQKIKGIMASLLCFAIVTMLLPMDVMATESSASGTCGENLTWTLDNQGTLTISGTGEMEDYRILHEEYEGRLYFGVHNAPWRSEDVISVIISDGVTSIGEYAFDGHYELTSVAIPPSMTEISAYAFNDCTGLVSISIPEGVTNIGICAFAGCENLDRITLPTSLESVGTNAFDDCYKMLDIHYTGTMAQWRTSNLEASIPHFQGTVIHYDGSPGFAQPNQRKPYAAGQFTDVPETSWYAPYVQTAYEHGMMEGVSDALFCPDGEITLAEALTVACRLHSQYYGLEPV